MTDLTLPADYDPRDGLTDGLTDKCPHCDASLHPDSYRRPVFDADGTEYEHLLDTDPMDRPFFCADCWPELKANVRRQDNRGLEEFV